jgi:peptidoglycan/LPS O-acetylase OafA/YrhL
MSLATTPALLLPETPAAGGQAADVPGTPDLRGHIPALDAVRGLAILLVTLYRFAPEPPASAGRAVRALFALFDLGDRGVDLFFVLSGFLITGILFDAKGSGRYFTSFYARRALRIFPLYYGTLLVFLVLLPLLAPAAASTYTAAAAHQGWLWLYGTNFYQAWHGAYPLSWFNHFWSLAVEEHFYLLWPLLLFFCSRRSALAVCAGCVAVAVACRVGLTLGGASSIAAYVLTPCRIDALAIGGLLALVARGPGGVRGLRPWALVGLGCAAGSLLLFGAGRGPRPWPQAVLTLKYTLFAGLFGGVLVVALLAAPGGLAGRCANARWLRFLGKYSYAMYVFQNPLKPAFDRLFPVGQLAAATGSALAGSLLYLVLATGATVAVAWLSWHLYEKHFLRLKTLFPQQDGRQDRPLPG